MVSAREKLSKCAMWEVDRRVLNELKDTGFDHLYELSKYVGRCHHDNRMIQTLIDNYDMEHCVFRVNGRYMLLGLEDVAYLTGLNIDGKLVVSSKEKINALGAVPSVMKKNGCSVRMSWLKDTFEKVPEGVGDSELEKYVSAFALYIIGTVILPTSDHVYVSLQYLDCLSKDKIKENAWGVAMLAHIHHCLKQYKINKMAAIGAHMHLLMVWALEHFPKFARELLSDDIVVPSEFPLSCSWAQLISKVLQKKYEIKKKNYQQHLVNLGNDDSDNKFVSMPYRRVLDLPPRLLEQLEMTTYVGPLVHPVHKKILPDHRPDLCPDQLGFERAVVSDSPSLLKKTCEYRSWRLHQNAWKKRKERLMRDSDAAEEQHRESPASARSTQGTHFQEQHVQYPAFSRSTQGTHLEEQGPEDENRHAGDLGNSASNTLDELEQEQQHEHEQQQQDEFENQRPQQPDVDMPNVDPASERDRHDVDIGGVPYVVMVENLEKGISPFTIMEFIHQQVSISCQVLVSPNLSCKAYSRATITVSSKKNQDKLSEFLENPNHSIVSSSGRPWVLTEKWPAHDIPLASIQALMANYQTMLQSRRTETSNELKVVLSGTEEYKTAMLLKDLFWEFIIHQARLQQRLRAEEAKIAQLFDAEEM